MGLEAKFEQEKTTKNTIRFQEIAEGEIIVGTLYVQKNALSRLGNPRRIKLTMEVEE